MGSGEDLSWKPGNGQLTVDEVVSNGGTITQTVVVDVAALAVKVLGNGDQVADGSGCANIREELPGLVLQANIPEGFPPGIHNRDLRVEVLEVVGV
jgi:hypothetical protein